MFMELRSLVPSGGRDSESRIRNGPQHSRQERPEQMPDTAPTRSVRRKESLILERAQTGVSEAVSRRKIMWSYLLCVLGAVVYSPDGLLIRVASDGTDKWAVVFLRSAAYILGLLLYLVMGRHVSSLEQFTAFGWLFPVAGLLVGIFSITFTLSVQYTAVANSLVIIACAPIFGAMFSFLLLGEKPRTRTIVTAIFCIGCIVFIFAGELQAGDSRSVAGMGLAACTAGALAMYFTLVRKAMEKAPNGNMIPCAITGQILNCIIALVMKPDWNSVDRSTLLWTGIDGAVVLVVANALLTVGTRHITAPEVNLIMMIETVVGPIWVYLAGYEAPPNTTVVGGTVLILALIAHSILAMRETSTSNEKVQKVEGKVPTISRHATPHVIIAIPETVIENGECAVMLQEVSK